MKTSQVHFNNILVSMMHSLERQKFTIIWKIFREIDSHYDLKVKSCFHVISEKIARVKFRNFFNKTDALTKFLSKKCGEREFP